MKGVDTNLVYYFYGSKDFAENRANKIHFNCLKYYKDRFDKSDFYIAVDDLKDEELIADIECAIIKCGYINANFHIIENTVYRESKAYFDGVLKKVKETNGLTFFAHNKGTTNYDGNPMECIDSWICGLYFLSLNDMDDVFDRTMGRFFTPLFYGSFLMESEVYEERGGETLNRRGIFYSGTFYWTHNKSLYLKCKDDIDNMYTYGRFSAEWFPSEMNTNWATDLSSKNNILLYGYDMYTINSVRSLNFILNDKEFEEYNKFQEKMTDVK